MCKVSKSIFVFHTYCIVYFFITATAIIRSPTRLLRYVLVVGLVIDRSLVRLLAGALSSQLGQLSLPSLCGR